MPPAAALMEELIEEILLRIPPHDPALLVRAALVCKQWCGIVSSADFRRRFRELHRTPPMLGFLYNGGNYSSGFNARFVRTAASCPPIADGNHCRVLHERHGNVCRVLDARHGHVLLQAGNTLVVWDSIADEQRELPFPKPMESLLWNAAVLCAAHGSCNHLDCHRRSPLVVFVCRGGDSETTIYTYCSNTATWSDHIFAHQHPSGYDYVHPFTRSALVGNALYFGVFWGKNMILKYELESHEIFVIDLPHFHRDSDLLVTTVDGGLGFVARHASKLYMCSRKDGLRVDAGWTQNRVIDLEMLLRSNPIFTLPYLLVGTADEVGVIFFRTKTDDGLFTFDLKTYKVKKICKGKRVYSIFPYLTFYTPALGAACRGNGPGGSSA